MATSVLIPVSEYLASVYHPDCEYVDGVLKERNMGEEAHAEIQAILARIIGNHRIEWGIRVLTEARVQTTETHYRIPDVCVVPSFRPRGRYIRYAPLVCIEILSPDDRTGELLEKVDEYDALGVENIWVIDPRKKLGYYASRNGLSLCEKGELRITGTPIQVSLAEVFAEMDES